MLSTHVPVMCTLAHGTNEASKTGSIKPETMNNQIVLCKAVLQSQIVRLFTWQPDQVPQVREIFSSQIMRQSQPPRTTLSSLFLLPFPPLHMRVLHAPITQSNMMESKW